MSLKIPAQMIKRYKAQRTVNTYNTLQQRRAIGSSSQDSQVLSRQVFVSAVQMNGASCDRQPAERASHDSRSMPVTDLHSVRKIGKSLSRVMVGRYGAAARPECAAPSAARPAPTGPSDLTDSRTIYIIT